MKKSSPILKWLIAGIAVLIVGGLGGILATSTGGTPNNVAVVQRADDSVTTTTVAPTPTTVPVAPTTLDPSDAAASAAQSAQQAAGSATSAAQSAQQAQAVTTVTLPPIPTVSAPSYCPAGTQGFGSESGEPVPGYTWTEVHVPSTNDTEWCDAPG